MFFWALFHGLRIAAIILLWKSIYDAGDAVGGYTFNQLASYYIAVYFIGRVTSADFEDDYLGQIKSGEISKYLLKPFSFKRLAVIQNISWRSLNFTVSVLLPAIVIGIVAPQWLTLPSPQMGIAIVFFLVLSYIIGALISLLIINIGFFIDQGRTLQHLKWMLTGLFSGSSLPLNLYPDWLRHIAEMLPFQFNNAVPIAYYLQTPPSHSFWYQAGLAIVWVVLLWIVMEFVWVKALKRFTAVGS